MAVVWCVVRACRKGRPWCFVRARLGLERRGEEVRMLAEMQEKNSEEENSEKKNSEEGLEKKGGSEGS